MVMIISSIFAIDKNCGIGKNNRLPWHLPKDLAFFKQKTLNKTVVMGRKTYDSIGRPLPNRRNLIITRNPSFQAMGCEVFTDFNQAIETCQDDNEVMFIGGAILFEQYLDKIDKLYLTHIDAEFIVDAYLPDIDFSQWEIVEDIAHQADHQNPYDIRFVTYLRKK